MNRLKMVTLPFKITQIILASSICLWLCSGIVCADTGSAQNAPVQQYIGDSRIVAARAALRDGNDALLELLATLSDPDHRLNDYVTYWHLLSRLNDNTTPIPTQDLLRFLHQTTNPVIQQRLRQHWLRQLAETEDWQTFLVHYTVSDNDDQGLQCGFWAARFHTGHPQEALNAVAQAWEQLSDAPKECFSIMHSAVQQQTVSTQHVWQRARELSHQRATANLLVTLDWLPTNAAPVGSSLKKALFKPEDFLDQLPQNLAQQPIMRQLSLLAVTRIARQNIDSAYARLARFEHHLSTDERRHAYLTLGYHAALSRHARALRWYQKAGNIAMTAGQRDWHARAALRARQWSALAQIIQRMPTTQRHTNVWRYWYGRSLAAQGQHKKARAQYHKIAGQSNYYGLLASAELGQSFQLPKVQATPISQAMLAAVQNNPAIQRALHFFSLDLHTEGTREWLNALENQNTEFLLAAAQLAQTHQQYQRAINTAEFATPEQNFALRFPLPFRTMIEPYTQTLGLDLAWVYGLIRQESRFMIPAQSGAGARGLMQVMPATGRWTAREIQLQGYRDTQLNSPDTNILLGTHYLSIILHKLDDKTVLATAGYNAGPGNAARWRSTRPIEGSIYIETIPFGETRKYVQKVLTNTVIYRSILQQKPTSLKELLEPV